MASIIKIWSIDYFSINARAMAFILMSTQTKSQWDFGGLFAYQGDGSAGGS
jgi:hypothetical protein